ncbi:MAG: chromosome segregation protein SMC, partial [Clostridia bacterium]|nr:chromosome segregation protein SMC [Clostridia bacterium]
LGAAMQHVVTDTESDAKRAIQFLKQTNGGRCTFLPVATIKGTELDEREYVSQSGFEGIASRLVEADEKYSGILRSLLGRTVVCDDMDNALKLAAKFGYKFRIVTLDGQIINAGGSMTGGSRKNTVGILGRSGEIERLRADEAELNSKAQKLEKEIRELGQSVDAVRAEFEGMQGDIIRAQEESVRLQSELRLVCEKLADYNESAQALNDEKAALNARADQLTQRKTQAEQYVARLSAEIAQCEAELEWASGEHSKLLEKRTQIDANISAINLGLVGFKKDIEANEQAIEAIIRQQEGHIDRCALIRAEAEEIRRKNLELEEEILRVEREAAELRERARGSRESIDAQVSERTELERRSSELRLLERAKAGEREKMSGELARLEERKGAMLREYDEIIAKLYDEYELTRREAEECGIKLGNPNEAKKRLNEIKLKIKGLGNVNVGAVEEYKEVSERYNFMNEQVSDIERSKAELIKIVNELTENMRVRFIEQFNKINENFKVCFTELFGGGSAQLILCDENDVLSCDIDIKVQPPGKNVQNIDLFSGGEKVMAAISLLFAILKVTPTPFCIFDEVEAALDDVNVVKYAEYMRKMTKNIQFIAITHRRGTMEEADVLYGVTMQEKGISKLLRLNTDEVAGKLGIDV